MRLVLDTNVLVSGLWNPGGPPGRLLRLLADGDLQPVLSPSILAEYREVLARRRFSFDPHKTAQLVQFIELIGLPVPGNPSGRQLPDPKDLPFLDAALEAHATALVTGNLRDFPFTACRPVKAVSPADFLREHELKSRDDVQT